MAHLAHHASHRLQSLTLTRCTSVSDAGFQAWAPHRFTELTHLSLADCTFLSDNAVVALVSAAKKLTHLDLSFCCALSDTATEVVALGLPRLRELRMAFCGSAVSDASLGCVALHLNDLRGLSVRGCVRVTGHGVENVLEGCGRLEWLDVSQCKNLGGWLAGGGVERWGFDERTVRNNKKSGTAGSGCEENKSKGKGKACNKDKDGDTQMVMGEVWVPPGAKVAARNALVEMQAHAAAAGGRGSGGSSRGRTAPKPLGPGPVLRPVIPPRGAPPMRSRKPVRFVVEKGPGGDLR
jgi:F-box/leucine-rich repeat protein 7